MKRPCIRTWCNWVLKAWEEIDSGIIVKAFKKCCISSALDGSEDDIIFEEESHGETASEDEDPFADITSDEEIDYSDV